jgi:hypothetical protein
METIDLNYRQLCVNRCPGKESSDIMEHLPTLYRYAYECESVFETGVRGCVSSWAFLYGLVNNGNTYKKRMFMNDINPCDINELMTASNGLNINIKHEWKNNLELEFGENETYDITFIDTWHIYGQLIRELNKFSKTTNKYMILHDTEIDAIYGETIRCKWDAVQQSETSGIPVEEILKGLSFAVRDFLAQNEDWYVKEEFKNNNGLTILARHPR